ncbi:MAG: endonuclease/exonuclease/phosphatase family protein [Clostridioides difficile]|nr:endonuclease/exonuclease/phosphatase family protein [Clostridioides sp.]MBS5788076.1 endonuclease/exonuclease/phosphatase family protein [Clostridioides difficile]
MRVITYNIHKGMDAKNKPTLLKIGKYLKKQHCDVICLQEVLYPQFLILKKQINMKGIFAANVKKPGMLYGICIFTKSEEFSSHHFLLTSKKEQRGALCLSYVTDNGYMNIINTHLGLDKEERNIQLNEIMDYTKCLVGNKIVCGDFNEKNINIGPFIDTAILADYKDQSTFWPSNSRIDYVFVDKQLSIINYKVDKIKLSDHFPLFCEISK